MQAECGGEKGWPTSECDWRQIAGEPDWTGSREHCPEVVNKGSRHLYDVLALAWQDRLLANAKTVPLLSAPKLPVVHGWAGGHARLKPVIRSA